MRKIIHNLRQQPEQVRHHVVHVTIAVAGVVLVAFWLLSFGGTFRNTEVMQAEFSDGLKPFAALSDSLADGYQSLGASAIESTQ